MKFSCHNIGASHSGTLDAFEVLHNSNLTKGYIIFELSL